jgi:hypothetical protein
MNDTSMAGMSGGSQLVEILFAERSLKMYISFSV